MWLDFDALPSGNSSLFQTVVHLNLYISPVRRAQSLVIALQSSAYSTLKVNLSRQPQLPLTILFPSPLAETYSRHDTFHPFYLPAQYPFHSSTD